MVYDICYIAKDPAAIFKEVRSHLQRVPHKVLSKIHGNLKRVSREELPVVLLQKELIEPGFSDLLNPLDPSKLARDQPDLWIVHEESPYAHFCLH
jgi:hypothetical protein